MPRIHASGAPSALRLSTLPALISLSLIGAAQANDAAVKAAADAFGTSIGRENIGLYSTSSVRGFSPTAAGNVRIDGLYFDQVWGLSARLRQASNVRVGLSAQGYAFPAPTGIVDHRLRHPEARSSVSLDLSLDHWGSRYVDLDFSHPLGTSGWALTGGFSASHIVYTNGTESDTRTGSLALWWRPNAGTEAVAFLSAVDTPSDQIGPQLSPAGPYLPPLSTPRHFNGPDWAAYSGTGKNSGVLLKHVLDGAWQLRVGLFHSEMNDRQGFSNLLLGVQPDGSARRLLIADPASRTASDSGELRLSWAFHPAPWAQRLHLQVAGRARDRRTGGSQSIDYGAMNMADEFQPARPAFQFGEQTQDSVRQHWLGLSYELRWNHQLELNAGVQRTDYRKRVAQPGLAEVQSDASPTLFNLSAAWHLSPTLAVYAGLTRGLEESGVAPGNASNRNQAMPAIRTEQKDAGLRWQMNPHMKFVAGVFEVRKPYFNLDANNLFTELGEVSHRGAELSLNGQLSPSWQVVTGAVLMQPRVQGEAVRLGRVGPRPVGQPERILKFNTIYRPSGWEGLSLNAGLSHIGSMPGTRNNQVMLPALTEVDLGLRQQLPAWGPHASIRLMVTNAFNRRSFELRGAGSYAERNVRQISVSLNTRW